MATPLATASGPDPGAVEGDYEEVFLELVLGDPDLLEAQFAAITGDDRPGKWPPGAPLVATDTPDPSGPAVLQDYRSGKRPGPRVCERTTRRRNRQRSPPAP